MIAPEKKTFESAISRSKYILRIYDRYPDDLDAQYAPELLRAALVLAVSALDNYMHELVVLRCWQLFRQPEELIPDQLKKVRIEAFDARKTIIKLQRSRNEPRSPRAGEDLKVAVQKILLYSSFQKPDDIRRCMGMLGIKGFWGKVKGGVGGVYKNKTEKEIRDCLIAIGNRRNWIVHEADLARRVRVRSDRLNEIEKVYVERTIDFIERLVNATDRLVEQHFQALQNKQSKKRKVKAKTKTKIKAKAKRRTKKHWWE